MGPIEIQAPPNESKYEAPPGLIDIVDDVVVENKPKLKKYPHLDESTRSHD